MRTIIAVDPGASGGIAVRWPHGAVRTVKMPSTPGGLRDLLRDALEDEGPAVLYLEDVIGNAGGTRTAQQGFSFGMGVGHIVMACLCLGIPRIDVKPKAWQKSLSLGTVGTKRATKGMKDAERAALEASNARLKREWKNKLLAEAQQRFADQEFRVTLWNADALLILSYAVEKELHR